MRFFAFFALGGIIVAGIFFATRVSDPLTETEVTNYFFGDAGIIKDPVGCRYYMLENSMVILPKFLPSGLADCAP